MSNNEHEHRNDEPQIVYMDRRQANGGIERHVQTIITAIVLAILLWMGNSMVKSQNVDASMLEKMEFLTDTVKELKKGVKANSESRYTKEDAAEDKRAQSLVIGSNSERINRLESEMIEVRRKLERSP